MPQPQLPAPPAPPSTDVVITEGGRLLSVGQNVQLSHLRELTATRQTIESSRSALLSQLALLPPTSASRRHLEAQVTQLDNRIATVDQMIEGVQVSPHLEPPQIITMPPSFVPERAFPKDIFVLSGVFMVCVLLPLAVAVAMRVLRRGAAKVAALPSDMAERFGRMEAVIEATAIEVERIGEGQRYLTRVLGDRKVEELLERPRPVAPYRVITPH